MLLSLLTQLRVVRCAMYQQLDTPVQERELFKLVRSSSIILANSKLSSKANNGENNTVNWSINNFGWFLRVDSILGTNFAFIGRSPVMTAFAVNMYNYLIERAVKI